MTIDYLSNITYNNNSNNSNNKKEIPNGKYSCILTDIEIKEIPIDWNKNQKHQLVLKMEIIENHTTKDKTLKGQGFYINHHIPFGINDPDFDKLIKPLQITCSKIDNTNKFATLNEFLSSDLSQNTNSVFIVDIMQKGQYTQKFIIDKIKDGNISDITSDTTSDITLDYDPFVL